MAVNTARVEKLRKRQIDGQSLKRLVEAGLAWLRTNQQTVNALNVFPVPDGDTGTNMMLTMTSAWNEVKDSGEKHVGRMASLIAKVFSDREIQRMRIDWIPQAKHVNVLRRLTSMRSTTYSLPARRTVAGDGNAKYQELQRACRQHEMARRWCSWGNLHKQLLS